jgi:cellulose synthase operon protein YhjQ
MPLIALVSPKGGVGKTTLAANFGYEFLRRGHRVVALDLDPQNALGLHFGADPQDGAGFITGLSTVPDPRRAWQAALRQTPSGLALLPHGQASFGQSLSIDRDLSRQPTMLLEPLQDMLRDPNIVLIVDTPPGPGTASALMMELADYLVIVLVADAASLVQLPRIGGGTLYRTASGDSFPPERTGFVINQIDMRSRLSRAAAEAAAQHLGHRLLGRIYRDEHVPEALACQSAVAAYAPYSKAAQDMEQITGRIATLIAPAQESPDPTSRPNGFLAQAFARSHVTNH